MLKKCAILGLAVLLVGGAALAWLFNERRGDRQQPADKEVKYSLGAADYLNKYGRWYSLSPEEQNQLVLELDRDRKTKTREELAEEQRARLRLDLDKLAAGEMNPGEIADFLYGSDWQQQVELYKKRKEQREIAKTISIVCLPIGGTILSGCFLIWFTQCLVRLIRKRRKAPPASPDNLNGQPVVGELTDLEVYAPPEEPDGPPQEKARRGRAVASENPSAPAETREEEQEESSFSRRLRRGTGEREEAPAAQAETDEGGVAVLAKEDEAPATDDVQNTVEPDSDSQDEGTDEKPGKRRFTPRPKVAVLGRELSALRDEANEERPAPDRGADIQEQADDLQKQLAEFRRMAQNVQQATRQQSDPLGSTLKDLAQQVSAIREYAASQQNRVEKLQDGYDWNIIRTFCLRVIRCIDNLENRVARLTDDEDTAAHLEEVRDELLFALESSGVEQFQLETNSEYRGQEKLAEAVKEKEAAQDPSHEGKIAKVIRPGYRYMIDEESFKVVRTAQVKLFG